MPLLLVAALAGGLATAGTAYTISEVVAAPGATAAQVTRGWFDFSPSTYILAGLGIGTYLVFRFKGA